jgi:AraC-like DNA-binding protein
MTYFYAAAAALILTFIFLIFKKKNKSTADYLLVGINLLVGCFLISDVLVNWKLTSATVIFQNGVPLFLFPVFALYVLQFTRAQKGSLRWFHYLIFLPGIIFLVGSLIDHYLLGSYSPAEVEAHFNTPALGYQLIFKGAQLLFIVILAYLLKGLTRFEGELKAGYSTLDTIDVKWLKQFTWIYLGSISLTFVLFLSQNLGLIPFDIKQVFGIVYGILVLSIFYMNYQGIQHYTLDQLQATPPDMAKASEIPPSAQEAPVLPSPELGLDEAEEKTEREMLEVIEKEKLYLEPKFSLRDLADRLGQSTHNISRIINAREGRTFYDLINGYRVQHLQQLLADPAKQHLTILALGLESGFNSKASLNRIFKNVTGLTPRQYLQKQAQSVE